MTTIRTILIKKEEDSEWEKCLELHIDKFDAIQVIIDEWGCVVEEYYDEKIPKLTKEIPISKFP